MLDLIYHNTPPCVDPGTQGGAADMEKNKRLGSWKKLFCHKVTDIHDFVSTGEEARRAQRLCKEVGQVLVRTYKRNDDATQFYQLPDEVVLAVDVTCTLMIFWIVARVDCGLVVKG